MQNLADLLLRQLAQRPSQRFGLIESPEPFDRCFDRAAAVASGLSEAGVRPGGRVAVIGHNSAVYLDVWMALQLAGVEAVLINPLYPDELLDTMLLDIEPGMVIWVGEPVRRLGPPGALHIDAVDLPRGTGDADFPGLSRKSDDIAGFMHTSGTSGRPKFCAQSHDYFLRMGRYIADRMALSPADTIFTPLPLFHINPLGYGIVTGLVAGANALSGAKFSASRFWPDVVRESVSVLIMHAPPIEILKKTTTAADAAGHRVRMCFYADSTFLDQFDIPLALSGYGSTEVGGVSHSWVWRRGDDVSLPEGISHYAGIPRPDVESRLTPDGEIELRGTPPTALFSGYHTAAAPAFDPDGWFATGDLGRYDDRGGLVFIERKAESLRVNGEYVPIPYVESHFSKVPGIEDAAIWRGDKVGDNDEVVVFIQADTLDAARLADARALLPKFMRPRRALVVARIPRDPGVGKVRRRELAALPVLAEHTFA